MDTLAELEQRLKELEAEHVKDAFAWNDILCEIDDVEAEIAVERDLLAREDRAVRARFP